MKTLILTHPRLTSCIVKMVLTTLLVLLWGTRTFAQDYDEHAQFPGGLDSLFRYVAERTVYPVVDERQDGVVMVRFTIDQEGVVVPESVSVLQGMGSLFDNEAIRVIISSPRWSPAKRNGLSVAQEISFPVEFRLP